MPRLAPAPESAPAPQPAWLPSRAQLLERPLEFGIAIDPPNSLEIDDAVYAEPLNEEGTLFMYKVHIADGGLLAGTDHLETARERGWSRYYADGTSKNMLPSDVLAHLSLGAKDGEEGQPAVTVSFIAGEGERPTGFDVYRSRLVCESLTYRAYARRVRQHHHPTSPLSFDLEATVFAASRFLSDSKRLRSKFTGVMDVDPDHKVPFSEQNAYDMNALYMLAANVGMARLSIERDLPYIFRNHHVGQLSIPEAIRELYPNSGLFARHKMAWYAPRPTGHSGINEAVFGHTTSPLRRSPDLVNHVNWAAALNGEDPPFDEAYMDKFARELADKIIAYKKLGSTTVPAPHRVA